MWASEPHALSIEPSPTTDQFSGAAVAEGPGQQSTCVLICSTGEREIVNMKLVLNGNDSDLNEAVRDYVVDRVIGRLSDMAGRIRSITISTRDENGPRGGIDHVVVAVIQLNSGKTVVVRNRTLDPYAGALAAIKKAVQLVRRARGRRRTSLRTSHRLNDLDAFHLRGNNS